MALLAEPVINLPTVYEFYTSGGINEGLSTNQSYFTLNNRNITIYSGAMHYFRVPKPYWRDRLKKMRAAGLNTIETYVPWNLHEPQKGLFDFGQGGSDMTEFLDVAEFLRTAQEEDLLAIVRPGPYICSEWEFGGLPSWLLRDKNLRVRTSEQNYMKYVTRYFNVLLPILAMFQFTHGGPVIAFQVENEYGSTERPGKFVPDRVYLWNLRSLMLQNGIVELLMSSDTPSKHGSRGTLPGMFLQTANFGTNPEKEFEALKTLQANKPTMAMEFWTGWYDHWSENHHTRHDKDFYNILEIILKYPASVNMYMFVGGTSFGFLNGADLNNDKNDNSGYQPDVTSYDYDGPLTESGNYTVKYAIVKELLAKYNPILTRLPVAPTTKPTMAYQSIGIQFELSLEDILNKVPKIFITKKLLPMELLPINNNSGQSYGYLVYRMQSIDIPANSVLRIAGHVCDTVIVLINGILMSKPLTHIQDLDGFGFNRLNNSQLNLSSQRMNKATIDLIIENWGRNSFGYLEQFNQYKGLWQGNVYLNNQPIKGNWQLYPLEFKRAWNQQLHGWHFFSERCFKGPALHKATLKVTDHRDTYIDMQDWVKGIVIVNNFVLGRYSRIGPQQTLYLPAPLLQKGDNTILIFEHYTSSDKVKFSDKPIYKTNK